MNKKILLSPWRNSFFEKRHNEHINGINTCPPPLHPITKLTHQTGRLKPKLEPNNTIHSATLDSHSKAAWEKIGVSHIEVKFQWCHCLNSPKPLTCKIWPPIFITVFHCPLPCVVLAHNAAAKLGVHLAWARISNYCKESVGIHLTCCWSSFNKAATIWTAGDFHMLLYGTICQLFLTSTAKLCTAFFVQCVHCLNEKICIVTVWCVPHETMLYSWKCESNCAHFFSTIELHAWINWCTLEIYGLLPSVDTNFLGQKLHSATWIKPSCFFK